MKLVFFPGAGAIVDLVLLGFTEDNDFRVQSAFALFNEHGKFIANPVHLVFDDAVTIRAIDLMLVISAEVKLRSSRGRRNHRGRTRPARRVVSNRPLGDGSRPPLPRYSLRRYRGMRMRFHSSWFGQRFPFSFLVWWRRRLSGRIGNFMRGSLDWGLLAAVSPESVHSQANCSADQSSTDSSRNNRTGEPAAFLKWWHF